MTLYFEEEEETEEYKIVTSIRGDSLKNLISIESPLGKALLGHKAGDRVYIPLNAADGYYVEVRSMEKTVDDGTDAIRSY